MTIILKNALGFLPLWVLILAFLSGCTTTTRDVWEKKLDDMERVRTIQNQYESSTYNGKY